MHVDDIRQFLSERFANIYSLKGVYDLLKPLDMAVYRLAPSVRLLIQPSRPDSRIVFQHVVLWKNGFFFLVLMEKERVRFDWSIYPYSPAPSDGGNPYLTNRQAVPVDAG